MNFLKITILTFCLVFLSSNAFSQNYTGSFDLVAEQTNSSGKTRKDTISYYFGKTKTAIIIHAKRNQPDLRMVFDFKDSTITSLFEMKGKKGGYILPMDDEHWPGLGESHYEVNKLDPNKKFKDTGNAKNIEDCMCDEVQVENSEYKATMWLCKEKKISMLQVLSYQSVGKGKSRKELELFKEFGINNLPLVMELESKTGKSDVSIVLVNFKNEIDVKLFSTEGHTVSKIK